ncbi:MAG: glycosyl hydrolase repeat-containing protein [Verrucomicrobia bacterium]|nr:glycosyl hydrolase repeat-containing protein [Verrucomicrobiota bacterium]
MLWLAAGLAAAKAAPVLPAPTDIEPTAEHPRSSEGSFATLRSGRIIFCYSRFYGGGEDSSPSAIAEIHSDDRGKTWSAPRIVVPTGDNQNVMSVSLLRLASGKLALFYLAKKNKWLDCHPYVRFSDDEGATWGPAVKIGAAPGYFELNNDRAVQLRSGRLILPVSLYRATGTTDTQASWDSRAIILWYFSDDDGATWTESSTWWSIPAVSRSGLQEPGVVELADGTLFSWSRTDQGAQYGFRSRDRGQTWSAPVPTELKSPESPASIKRLPGSDALIAVFNDHSGRFPFPLPAKKRTPLVVALSTDGGDTWPTRQLLEDDPSGWYCYTAIHFTDEGVLLAYCASTQGLPHLSRLRIRLVPWNWLQLPTRR